MHYYYYYHVVEKCCNATVLFKFYGYFLNYSYNLTKIPQFSF